MKHLALILIALLILTAACTKTVKQTTDFSKQTTDNIPQNNQEALSDDLTSELVIEEPQDPGMLDTTDVSDSIPE